ncbi:hypothetical protein RN001_011527 [Aquatica leii]|uniref:F-box domain-containing protein n=1 Tax=Aquatica leii TaxID=1421715 RepID=A0AAN7Q0T8_9COLE|nr:hypothetical protein RN001_011527 [Aquatica leii]
MSHSTIRNIQQTDVLLELKSFIGGATQTTKYNHFDLTKAALSLLKTLPAARDAVLEYFCVVFNTATQNFIVRIETEIATGQLPPVSEDDEAIISEIHTVICSLVSLNAEAWAPIISTWSLELLGELSTRYAGRAHVSTSVNETLQLWMSCRATRTLIDITTQCLSSLIHSDTEACINALLDTSVKHSPNFDWVVAHVGSCFPTTVITRVLSCGLKDFCQNKSYEQGSESPKLKSVVGILGHLAGSHCDDICTALLDLFKWSLQPLAFNDSEELKPQKKATVPFLLQLAYLSPTLLQAISKDIKETLPVTVIVQLCNFIDDWCKYFGSPEALKDFIVNLIIKCEVGGVQIINILLDCIFMDTLIENDSLKNDIKKYAQEMIEYIMQEIDCLVRTQSQHPNAAINILESFIREVEDVFYILHSEQIRAETASRIIIFIGHSNPSVLVKACVHLFKNAVTDEHLSSLVQILTNELLDKTIEPYCEKGGHFAIILEQVLTNVTDKSNLNDLEEENLLRILKNLLTLLRWEKSEQFPLLQSKLVWRAIHANLVYLTKLFGTNKYNVQVYHAMAELLDLLQIPSLDGYHSYSIPVQAILNFTMATVNYFFMCCDESDEAVQLVGYQRVCDILKRVTLHSKAAKMLALRELLEAALFGNNKALFGAKIEVTDNDDEPDKYLLEQNRKKNKTIALTKNSSILNGGMIGSGRKRSIHCMETAKDVCDTNIEQFIRALKACCSLPSNNDSKSADMSLDSLTSVSLLLVQFVSPDVMYNGLPWPEEEFCKVTIERDFYIRKLFNSSPLLWELLTLVAMYRPTLCYCSVLLRAITATLIHQWNSIGDQTKFADPLKYKSMLDTTRKVLDVMALGQLLPPPLSDISTVIPYFNCSEIVQILRDCVWNYMRDHVPSPALFNSDNSGIYWRDPTLARPPDIYTTTLRIIMQQNIETVGHLYSYYIDLEKEDGDEIETSSGWSQLPDVLLEEIFSYLSIRQKYYASLVCKSWYNAFYLPKVWAHFVLEDSTLTRGRFNYYSGWQYVLDHLRTQACMAQVGRYFRHLTFEPMLNFYNLYEFMNMISWYTEQTAREVAKKGVGTNIQSLKFTFPCNMSNRDETERIRLFGTGGKLLEALKRLMGNLKKLKTIELIDLMLDSQEAQYLLDGVCETCYLTLKTMILVNTTRAQYQILHIGIFLNLNVLVISPQNLGEETVELLGYTKLKHLHIFQNRYTPNDASIKPVPVKAWRTCQKNNPHLCVHLQLQSNKDKQMVWQECAPVKTVMYDSPHIGIQTFHLMSAIELYSKGLCIYGHKSIPRFYRSKSFHERVDSTLLLLCRQCPSLKVLIVTERISTSTVLLLANAAKKLRYLYVRANAVIKRCDWTQSPEWSDEFYAWLRYNSKSYELVENEVSQMMGYKWKMQTDKQFKNLNINLHDPEIL